jgi:hypothetical protein
MNAKKLAQYHKATIRAIVAVLDDDEGISLEAYETLCDLGAFLPDYGTPIFNLVEATDGRYYLTEEAVETISANYFAS